MEALGKKIWIIPEGYIPKESSGQGREMLSHETACILNTSDDVAHLKIYIYFSNRDPAGPYLVNVEPRRTKHLRFNDLQEPAPVPLGQDYSSVFISDIPVIIQHTRLDSRQP